LEHKHDQYHLTTDTYNCLQIAPNMISWTTASYMVHCFSDPLKTKKKLWWVWLYQQQLLLWEEIRKIPPAIT